MSLSDELHKLGEMKSSGLLTDQEFSDAKARLFQGQAPAVAAAPDYIGTTKLYTTQETSKRLKLHQLLSTLSIIFFGVIAVTAGSIEADGTTALFGFLCLLAISWLIVTRFRVWWHHK